MWTQVIFLASAVAFEGVGWVPATAVAIAAPAGRAWGGLSFCVTQAFMVDIDSTLYRIVAFVVPGVVLLRVGFSTTGSDI